MEVPLTTRSMRLDRPPKPERLAPSGAFPSVQFAGVFEPPAEPLQPVQSSSPL